MSKSLLKSFIFIFLCSFYSCDEVIECILKIEPEIHTKPMMVGQVYDEYYDVITAEVRNEPNDNDYNYFFDVRGELPPGVSYQINYRNIEFYGVPLSAGIYRFEVELTIELDTYDEYDSSPACGDTVVEQFRIKIEP
jgi:hypothetical protein